MRGKLKKIEIYSDRSLLNVNSLSVNYQKNNQMINVLKDFSFSLNSGEVLCILGESGSGKSTVVKAITGLLPPSAKIEGNMELDSCYKINFMDDNIFWSEIRGKGIGFIFQDAQQALNPMVKIKEQFKESILFHQIGKEEDVISISKKYLSFLNFQDIDRVLASYPFQLSGGMCQRVCIALSLCLQPKILIADEATSALDIVSQIEVINLLKKVKNDFNLSIIFITHDIAVASAIADRIIVLNKGKVEEEGYTEHILKNPHSNYTKKLLDSRKRITCLSNYMKQVEMDQEPILQIKQLGKVFNGNKKKVLSDITISVRKREIVGILGESGCGKSTLAKCIVGLEKPNNGQILHYGRGIHLLEGKKRREMCKHIQLIFQDARACLNPRRTALELVKEPAKYLHLHKHKDLNQIAKFCLNEVGISEELQSRRPPELSTGQCQRVAIARALMVEPELLICDEAVSALDMSIQAQMLELLLSIHNKIGISILMISHDIRILRSFCHSIAIMDSGCFCEILNTKCLTKYSTQKYTKKILRCEEKIERKIVGEYQYSNVQNKFLKEV